MLCLRTAAEMWNIAKDTMEPAHSKNTRCAICPLGRGLKTKSWNIKTWIAELGVFMHKFAIENDPKP